LREEFERAGRTGAPLTVAMFDLDHFKSVNDRYGHQAGDRVLQHFADILRQVAREVDRLGRYGGEEFLAILPATSTAGGAVFVERVRTVVERFLFTIDGSAPVRMTVSAGVATYPHESVWNVELLVRRADEALYAAKARGRNCAVRFDELETRAEQTP
jgi:diguanylate cyclase (GGDEF)-like protein